MDITIADAIRSLRPGAKYIARNGAIAEWHSTDIPQPTDAEIEAEVERLIAAQPAIEIRAKRNAKLAATDWRVTKALETGLALAPEWADYRQALRDIPQQDGFPHDVVWPQEIN